MFFYWLAGLFFSFIIALAELSVSISCNAKGILAYSIIFFEKNGC